MDTAILKEEQYKDLGAKVADQDAPMAKRMRAVFTLRSLGTNEAVDALAPSLSDKSALLGHEVAYCLGQTRNPHAIPHLIKTLENDTLHPMVRHEAAEALGAIGGEEAVEVLTKYKDHELPEIRDTCRISLNLLDWKKANKDKENANADNPVYMSVDPAPPLEETKSIEELRAHLMDKSKTIFERYRALFALRNIGSDEAVKVLCEALHDEESGAVFTHEVAYVMGQMQHKGAIEALQKALQDPRLNAMVRHEAAEALGSIADTETIELLEKYSQDPVEPVKESCVVALDILNYQNSDEFQYADALTT